MMKKLRYISSLVLTMLLWLLSAQCVCAQDNPFRYGSPMYWQKQSMLDKDAGKFDAAYEDLKKAEKGYGELGNTELQAQMIQEIGLMETQWGRWDEAKEHYLEALRMVREEKNEIGQAIILIGLLELCRMTGDNKNFKHYDISLDSLFFASQSAQIQTLIHMYRIKYYIGTKELTMAEVQLKECWDDIQKLNLIDRESAKLQFYGFSMTLKKLQGKNQEAIKYAKDYIEQTGKLEGKNSPKYYQAYRNLCELYSLANDNAATLACLDSLENGVGYPHQDQELIAAFYNIKGICHYNLHNYDKAIVYFNLAYNAVLDKTLEESAEKFKSLQYKGEAYYKQKRYNEAFDIYRKYTEIIKKKYGEPSSQYQMAIFILANIEGASGNKEKADSLFSSAMCYFLKHAKQSWKFSTASQRELLWKEVLNYLPSTSAFATRYGFNNNKLTELCYDATLFTKALLLDTERSVVEIIRNEGTAEDVENYRLLYTMNNKLQELQKDYEHNRHRIDSLTYKRRELEQKLSSKCLRYKEYNAFMDLDYQTIRKSLKENEVVVDFADYIESDSLQKYDVYIFKRDMEHPFLTRCFRQGQLDSLLNGAQSYVLYDQEQTRTDATQLLWGAIREHVKEGSTVYYIPSGAIHGIALEALPMADGTTLGKHYNFVRLTSARELMRIRRNQPVNKTATLYGGLKYDLSREKMEEESLKYDTSDLAWMMRSGYGDKGFGELKKTREEVEKIGQTLRNNGYTVTTYMGAKGNVESFLNMNGKAPSIIHIATHGFYYTPDEAKNKDFFIGYADDMLMSGLVFSGGNVAWLNKNPKMLALGGILTAKDIANLDLSGTDLAVLSACKTAQGKVTSEGIYGLQRAFKKAGVGTIVMSLWSVNDKVTAEFMTTFYERLTAPDCAWDKRKAFEQTKEIIRKKHPDPYLCAAFVMLD